MSDESGEGEEGSDASEDSDIFRKKEKNGKLIGSLQDFTSPTPQAKVNKGKIDNLPFPVLQNIFSYLNLQEQITQCLPLSKKLANFLTENADEKCA